MNNPKVNPKMVMKRMIEGNGAHQAMAASHAALMKVIPAIGKVRFAVTIAQVIS